MKRLKLKENAKKNLVGLAIVVLLIGIIIYGIINTIQKNIYENSYEYKLVKKGYTEEDAKKIKDFYKDKELDYILKNKKSNIYLNIIKEKYFRYDNLYKYIEYTSKLKDINYSDVVRIINTNRDKPFYEGDLKTNTDMGKSMLVNKYYGLDESYIPDNLVEISRKYAYGDKGSQKVTQEVYDAYKSLWTASNNNGFYLMVSSSYRDYNHQLEVYEQYKKRGGTDYADSIAARPGHSEHQTGLVLDIFEKGYVKSNFHESDSYKWLKENAHKYGFIERYPSDKVDTTGYNYESWHYRYVGKEIATYIYKNNITFDEWYAYFYDKSFTN